MTFNYIRNILFHIVDYSEDEGERNRYLLQFISSSLHISSLDLSLLMISDKLAVRIENIDYEDIYLKLKEYL